MNASSDQLSLQQPLLDASQAARLLAVRPSWIYEAVRNGHLPCLKVGRHVRFTQAMLEAWLATQITGSTALR